MKITLMYNPQAGGCELPIEDLVSKLQQRGAEVSTQVTQQEDYKKALEQACDFILIAGGDGTIGKVAKKAFYKQVPIAILPFGSANNIAGSLVVDSALDAIFDGWNKKEFRQLSVGSISFDGNREEFLESVGWGLFADVLKEIKEGKRSNPAPVEDKRGKVETGLEKLSHKLQKLRPYFYQIFLDGVDYSGEYLWVEVMNTQSMGPRLQLAPEASHGDSFLDVILVKEEGRLNLEYFLGQQKGANPYDSFHPIKAKNIKIRSDQPIHVDDKIVELEGVSEKWTEISLMPPFLKVINA